MTDGALLQRRPGLARAALLIASLTVLARLVGFARVLVFARTVGPTCLGDTYYTANTIPNILFDVVAGGALSSLVVPLLADAADRADVDATSRTAPSDRKAFIIGIKRTSALHLQFGAVFALALVVGLLLRV